MSLIATGCMIWAEGDTTPRPACPTCNGTGWLSDDVPCDCPAGVRHQIALAGLLRGEGE